MASGTVSGLLTSIISTLVLYFKSLGYSGVVVILGQKGVTCALAVKRGRILG